MINGEAISKKKIANLSSMRILIRSAPIWALERERKSPIHLAITYLFDSWTGHYGHTIAPESFQLNYYFDFDQMYSLSFVRVSKNSASSSTVEMPLKGG